MIKQKKLEDGQISFWERNRKSGGYLLKKRIMDVAYQILVCVINVLGITQTIVEIQIFQM